MTNHLKYIDVREYARVVDIARELIERAEKAEAALQRVREVLARYVTVPLSEMSQTDALGAIGEILDYLEGDGDE